MRDGLEQVQKAVLVHGARWATVQKHPQRERGLLVQMSLGKGDYVVFDVIDHGDRYEVQTPFIKPETGDKVHFAERRFDSEKGLVDCVSLVLMAWKPDHIQPEVRLA